MKSKYWESNNPAYSSLGTVEIDFVIYNMGNGAIFINGNSYCGSESVLINADDYIKPNYYATLPNSKFKYFISYITRDVDLHLRGIDYVYSVLSKLIYSIRNNKQFWDEIGFLPLHLTLYLNCITINNSNFDPYCEIKYEMPFKFRYPKNIDDVLFIQFMMIPRPIESMQVNDVCDYTCTIFNPYKRNIIISDQYLFKENNLTKDYVRDMYTKGWFKRLNILGITEKIERSNITSALAGVKFGLDSMIYNATKSGSKEFNSVFFANYIINNIHDIPLPTLLSITYPNRKVRPKVFIDKYDYYDIFYHDNLNTIQDYKTEYINKSCKITISNPSSLDELKYESRLGVD